MSSKFMAIGVWLLSIVLLTALSSACLAKDKEDGRDGGRSGEGRSGQIERQSGDVKGRSVDVDRGRGDIEDRGKQVERPARRIEVPDQGGSGVHTPAADVKVPPFAGRRAVDKGDAIQREGRIESAPDVERNWTWGRRHTPDTDDWRRLNPWYSWYGFRVPEYYYYSGSVYVHRGNDRYPPVAMDDFYSQALTAFRQGDYANAATLAGHAVVDNPRSGKGHVLLMLATFALRDYRTAAMEAHAVAEIGRIPDWPTLSAIYDNVDPYADQLRQLEAFVADSPSAPEGRFLLGFQYLMAGHRDAAQKEFSQAVALVPQDRLAAALLTQTGGTMSPAVPSAPASR